MNYTVADATFKVLDISESAPVNTSIDENKRGVFFVKINADSVAQSTILPKTSAIINYEIKEGKDFLLETNKIDCDLCIFNPPFSLDNGKKELAAETFLDKVIELCGNKIEIIMICPMGFRLNQTIRSKRLNKMKNIYPEISSIISLPVDTFENTNFHTEILCYNTPYLKAHYFV